MSDTTARTLNLLVIGQSNAYLFNAHGAVQALADQVQNLLGWNGTTQVVDVISDVDSSFRGTPMLPGAKTSIGFPTWLNFANGTDSSGGFVAAKQLNVLTSYLTKLPAGVKSAPTVVIEEHNETDSTNPSITTGEWEGAVRFEEAAVAAALGQQPSSIAWGFANVPYAVPSSPSLLFTSSAKAIRVAQEALASAPDFNGFIAAHFGDANMNGTDATSTGYGGQHASDASNGSVNDDKFLVAREARSIAWQMRSMAIAGSPIALAGGAFDVTGPQVTSISAVAGAPNTVLAAVKLAAGSTGLVALSAAASAGAGWSMQIGSTAYIAISAQLVDATHVSMTFGRTVPADGTAVVYYGGGDGRIDVANGAGIGSAIYDSNGLPLWGTANGFGIDPGAGAGGGTPTPPAKDTLVLNVSEDAYAGDAQFKVSVDGVRQGGTFVATASHAAGETQAFAISGFFGSGVHTVAVSFLNDKKGTGPGQDRNLYVDGMSYDGVAYSDNTASLRHTSTSTFQVGQSSSSQTANLAVAATPSGTIPTAGADTLVLHVSEDAYAGDAQFKVSVDGVQYGATFTATASHSAGEVQDVTIIGAFGSGPHAVAVSFLNDKKGAGPGADRNLHVDGMNYDGTEYASNTEALFHNETVTFQVGTSSDNASVRTLLASVNVPAPTITVSAAYVPTAQTSGTGAAMMLAAAVPTSASAMGALLKAGTFA